MVQGEDAPNGINHLDRGEEQDLGAKPLAEQQKRLRATGAGRP